MTFIANEDDGKDDDGLDEDSKEDEKKRRTGKMGATTMTMTKVQDIS